MPTTTAPSDTPIAKGDTINLRTKIIMDRRTRDFIDRYKPYYAGESTRSWMHFQDDLVQLIEHFNSERIL